MFRLGLACVWAPQFSTRKIFFCCKISFLKNRMLVWAIRLLAIFAGHLCASAKDKVLASPTPCCEFTMAHAAASTKQAPNNQNK
jgi:hypothetical protein